MDLQIKGKVAVVTGGTKGIGRGCCDALAGEGVNLVINYRSDPANAEKVKKEIEEKFGVQVALVMGDASKVETVDAIFDKAIEVFGDVDIVVNNAGGGGTERAKPFEDQSYENWRACQDNTVNGQFLMCRKFVGYWKKAGKGGHIINVLSKSCLMTNSIMNQPYASAKGALLALTRSLAHEVTPYGIIVNGIVPGYVQTERSHAVGTERYKKMLPLLPTGRFGTPYDMGVVVAFLSSPLSNQIIGAVVDCTGGTLL